jgi:hypothetical protein
VFSKMLIVESPPLMVPISGFPSWVKSATTSCNGFKPTRKRTGDWKLPSPFPNNTDTWHDSVILQVPTARSRMPSPLKSAVTISPAPAELTKKDFGGQNVPSPLPKKIYTELL